MIWLHALRNALIPVVTTIGLQVSVLMGGAILTETIFSWPGIGKWMIDSISRRDYQVVQGGLLLIAADRDAREPDRRPPLRTDQSPCPPQMTRHLGTAEQDAAVGPPRGRAAAREFWHYFTGNRGAVIGLVVLAAHGADRRSSRR